MNILMLFRQFAGLKYVIKDSFLVGTLWFISTVKCEDAYEQINGRMRMNK
jgi:hypothetical protein